MRRWPLGSRFGCFAIVKSRWRLFATVVAGLALGGAILTGLVVPQQTNREESGARLRESPGAGALFGWLGGFRALAADLLWLRMYAGWERRDLPGTQTLIRAVVAVDPRPAYFWINGARILAYDQPVWRIEAEGGFEAVPTERRRVIEVEQARLALRLLEEARGLRASTAAMWTEQANIELNKLGDIAAAAASFRRAWEQPAGPYYAARIYGELLRRLDRHREAYEWLCSLYPKLPPDDEAADAPLVLARIRELERMLAVPPAAAFRSGR